MRTIKFRGKLRYGGRWVYGSLLTFPDGDVYMLYDSDFAVSGAVSKDPVQEKTVGQFTGVRDKNGKEIYEGDIVECVSWNEYFSKDGKPIEPFRRKMFVDYRNGCFKMVEPMPEPMKDNEWDIICDGDIVIIGNIYDNEELLKK